MPAPREANGAVRKFALVGSASLVVKVVAVAVLVLVVVKFWGGW